MKRPEHILKAPRITEKSALKADDANNPAYTFVVADSATKGDVASAIKTLYKVKPTKVAMIKTPARKVFSRGKLGTTSGFKKAVVYLKKGEKISFA